jgi:hypothetical protein
MRDMGKLETLLARRPAIARSGSRVLIAWRRRGGAGRSEAESVADLVHQRSLLGEHDQEGWQQG